MLVRRCGSPVGMPELAGSSGATADPYAGKAPQNLRQWSWKSQPEMPGESTRDREPIPSLPRSYAGSELPVAASRRSPAAAASARAASFQDLPHFLSREISGLLSVAVVVKGQTQPTVG